MPVQSDFFHYFLCYLVLYPFLCITLAELLKYLIQGIPTNIRNIFQGNTDAESSGDVQETSWRSYQLSTGELLTSINGVLMEAWSILTSKWNEFITLFLRRDNVILEGDNSFMNVGPSGDGRNENQESEVRPPVSAPETCARRLRSGRLYDITPVLDSPSVETRRAALENSQNRRSPASNKSSSRRQRSPNWFGDGYRLRLEERTPDYVQRYGRPSSLLLSLSSPASLINMNTAMDAVD